jgi:hypothetical protein
VSFVVARAEETIKTTSESPRAQNSGTTLEYTPKAIDTNTKAPQSHQRRGSLDFFAKNKDEQIIVVLQRKNLQKGLGLTLGTYVDRWRLDDGTMSAGDDQEKELSYQRVDGIKAGAIADKNGIQIGDVILEINGNMHAFVLPFPLM